MGLPGRGRRFRLGSLLFGRFLGFLTGLPRGLDVLTDEDLASETTALAKSSHLEQKSSNDCVVEIRLDHSRTNSLVLLELLELL